MEAELVPYQLNRIENVGDISLDSHRGKDPSSPTAVLHLVAAIARELDAPAVRILDSALESSEMDPVLERSDHLCRGSGASAEVRVRHPRIRLVLERLPPPVSGPAKSRDARRKEIGERLDEDAIVNDLGGTRFHAFVIEVVGTVGVEAGGIIPDRYPLRSDAPIEEVRRSGAAFHELIALHAVAE